MKKEKPETLEQARDQIDAIDSRIIELIAARQFYVDQALRFKNSVKDVQAPERVDFVIEHVRTEAQAKGVNADVVERMYREMIQYLIQRELKEIRP